MTIAVHLRRYGTLTGFALMVVFFAVNLPDTFLSARNLSERVAADFHAGGGGLHHDGGHVDGGFRPVGGRHGLAGRRGGRDAFRCGLAGGLGHRGGAGRGAWPGGF